MSMGRISFYSGLILMSIFFSYLFLVLLFLTRVFYFFQVGKMLPKYNRNLLEASADKVHEKRVATMENRTKIFATSPSFLALAVCYASRTSCLRI